jgi:hypothetical protein
MQAKSRLNISRTSLKLSRSEAKILIWVLTKFQVCVRISQVLSKKLRADRRNTFLPSGPRQGVANMLYFDRVVAEAFVDRHGELLSQAVDYWGQQNARRPGVSRRFLSRLGVWLVAIGQHLEQYGQMQQRPDLTMG